MVEDKRAHKKNKDLEESSHDEEMPSMSSASMIEEEYKSLYEMQEQNQRKLEEIILFLDKESEHHSDRLSFY